MDSVNGLESYSSNQTRTAAQTPGEHSKAFREQTANIFRADGVEVYRESGKKAFWPAELEWSKRRDPGVGSRLG
jgi:hypothetical protein